MARRGRRRRRKHDFHYRYRTSRIVAGDAVEHTLGCKHFRARTRLGARLQLSSFVAGDFPARRGGTLADGLCPPQPGGETPGSSWQLIERSTFEKPSFGA